MLRTRTSTEFPLLGEVAQRAERVADSAQESPLRFYHLRFCKYMRDGEPVPYIFLGASHDGLSRVRLCPDPFVLWTFPL